MKKIKNERRLSVGTVPRKAAGSVILTTVLLSVLVIVIAGVGLLTWCGFKANRGFTIYPNVSACGINFGGKTTAEAETILNKSKYASYNGKSVSVDFISEVSPYTLVITSAQAGLETDIAAAAKKLYAFGRDEDAIKSTVNYLRCIFKVNEIFTLPSFQMNDEAVRTLIKTAAEIVNTAVVDNVIFTEANELRCTRGKPGLSVDETQVFKLIKTAFEKRDFNKQSYTPTVLEPEALDAEKLYTLIHKEPVDAKFDDKFNVVPESAGITFDKEAAKKILISAGYGETIIIPLKVLEPSVLSKYLQSLLYRDRLATVTTPLTNNETRSMNIQLAAKAIDGDILLPGKIFSYNDSVGQRTIAKGYGAATAYSYGELVQEVGGGICQLSSTLYYCCLLSNFDIVYRTGHIYYQTYVPYGMDATVSWGGPDYKFKNNTPYPVKICAWRTSGYITVELWGTKTDATYVKMEYEVNETYPSGTSYKEDASVPKGSTKIVDSGRNGMKVTTYRCVYGSDGKLLSKKVEDISKYSPRNAEIHVAPGELPN